MHGSVGLNVLVANHRLHQMFRRWLGISGGLDLGAAQAQPCGEYREKPVAVNRLSRDIGQCDQREGQVIVG
ncbi:hypothetical protein D3C87_1118020 [compost metagenome]